MGTLEGEVAEYWLDAILTVSNATRQLELFCVQWEGEMGVEDKFL